MVAGVVADGQGPTNCKHEWTICKPPLWDARKIPGWRRVQCAPGSLRDRPPRGVPPAQDLPDPRPHQVPTVEEGGSPSAFVAVRDRSYPCSSMASPIKPTPRHQPSQVLNA